MNNRELDKKRKKAQARRAAAAEKRTAKLMVTRWNKPKTDDKWANRHGWKPPESFMTGENP
jgi:hypothetical protein